MPPNASFLRSLRLRHGYARIAGADEVGCGCLAGPVVSAAVILPEGVPLPRLDDSKRVAPLLRATLAARIKKTALAWAVGLASVEEIDALGIRPATLLASRRALLALDPLPDAVVSDAFRIPDLPFPCHPLVRADARCRPVAAASIIAKVHRDALAEEWAARFPGYGFAGHKGYGTKAHTDALGALGPCELHRRSFAPVQEALRAPGGPPSPQATKSPSR